MENISIVFAKQFTNKVEFILHSPCNIPSKMFEMTVVVDGNLAEETVKNVVPNLLRVLKRHSDVFANVRLNEVRWSDDTAINNQIVPMSMAMLTSHYDGYEQQIVSKKYEALMRNLKLFHARSKLIIVVTDGNYSISNQEELKKIMQPFLYRKVMNVVINGDGIQLR